jgi:hypothetical protein
MPGPAVQADTGLEPLERETIPRVARRLLPLLMLGYFCAYLDRVNVGFAGLTMNKALGFSSAVFGFGSGVFFIGYFLAEVPSNLILEKVGARRWISPGGSSRGLPPSSGASGASTASASCSAWPRRDFIPASSST